MGNVCSGCGAPAEWMLGEGGGGYVACRPCRERGRKAIAGQSRAGSFAESAANTAIGYAVAVAAQAVILPAFGLHASTGQHLGIAACFTAVSLVRGYVLRRVFNRYAGR